MPSTSPDSFPYPSSGSAADVPSDLKALADQIQAKYGAISLDNISGGAKGKIIVCNSSGVPKFVTPSGDLTLSEAGDFELGAKVVGTTELGDKAVTGAKVDDATLGDDKLVSPNNAVYRTLLSAQEFFNDGCFAKTYPMQRAGETTTAPQGNEGNSAGTWRAMPFFYFDDADYKVAGLTQKLRLRAQIACNATKAAIKFTFGLYPLTVAGAADTLKVTLGEVITGSTVEINEPAASTVTPAVGADFAIPVDGAYVLGVVTSAQLTADSYVLTSAQLQSHNI